VVRIFFLQGFPLLVYFRSKEILFSFRATCRRTWSTRTKLRTNFSLIPEVRGGSREGAAEASKPIVTRELPARTVLAGHDAHGIAFVLTCWAIVVVCPNLISLLLI